MNFIRHIWVFIFMWSPLLVIGQSYHPFHVIVKLKSSENIDTWVTNYLSQHRQLQIDHFHPVSKVVNTNSFILKFKGQVDIPALCKDIEHTQAVLFAEPDYIGSHTSEGFVPDDSLYSRQWSLKNDGSFSLAPATAGADMAMEQAWSVTTGSPFITVAVLDGGCKMDHPEFQGRWAENQSEILNGLDDDANGYIDDYNGWDFVNSDNDPTDDNGHGTNVTGILGATGNNGSGYAGIDWNCKLLICKVTDDSGFGYYSWWTDAIYYAVSRGATVINMSLGGTTYSSTLEDAINYAHSNGVVVVAAMGNNNSSLANYPAAYTKTVAVGSTDPDDTRSNPFFWSTSSGSNYGNHIDVVAPGNYIYGLSHTSNTNYNTYYGGTSMAAPAVSGLVSLYFSIYPFVDVESVRQTLQQAALDMVGDIEDLPGWDQFYGYGRVSAAQLLTASTSINTESNLLWKVYPNPASNRLQLNRQSEKVRMYNSLGKIVLTRQNTNEIEVASLPNGLYILELEVENQLKTLSISVQH